MSTRLEVSAESTPNSLDTRLKVIYLAGAPHSGSTILESILTASPNIRGLGQFGRFYAYRDFDTCSCGEPPVSCVPCRAVTSEVIEPRGANEYRRIGRITRREWGLPLLLVSSKLRRLYREPSEDAFRAVAATCGVSTLLESSKSISRGLALVDTDGVEVIVVHTVRDFAGFITSREKRTEKSSAGRDVLRLWKWMLKNALVVGLLKPRSESFFTVRFEDLAADPAREVERLCDAIGVDSEHATSRLSASNPLHRTHLFEPPRQFDYRGVVFDPNRRRAASTISPKRRSRLWRLGGKFGSRWGYTEETPNPDYPASG